MGRCSQPSCAASLRGSARYFPIATRASPISRRRGLTSGSRQRINRSRMARGVSLGSWSKSIGARKTSDSVCDMVSPPNNCWPASISYSTTPYDQMSARRTTGFPAACSGLIYAAVPMIIPACVAAMVNVGEFCGEDVPALDGCAIAANPKSSTFTRPAGAKRSKDFVRAEFVAGGEEHISESVQFSRSGNRLCLDDGVTGQYFFNYGVGVESRRRSYHNVDETGKLPIMASKRSVP
jgi:hypothetical protein